MIELPAPVLHRRIQHLAPDIESVIGFDG